MAKVNLMDLTLEQMKEFLINIGEEPYRGKQLCQWVLQKGVKDFNAMTNISKALRQKLERLAALGGVNILARQESAGGDTVKYLFQFPDGQAVESVLMKHSYGRTACVSTQVGCRMGCRFCASTIEGMVRNLKAGEIYDQVLAIQRDTGERVSHVVLMGSGEPLDNYDNAVQFIKNVTAPYGLNISYRHITLSTCGIVPGIKKLAREKMPITLAVSLHAPNDRLRNQLMPINRRYPLGQLIPACREYAQVTGRRITFEYSLIKDVNDRAEHASELGELLKHISCHVNLIPVNPVRERGFNRTPQEQVNRFKNILAERGINATVRKEMGTDIDAACGQLRRKTMKAGLPQGGTTG
ncbi:23S rRNA (adenine2503-C2)-methyltransferase [Desulfohalotomaculum tongense]|uniref:23S rRNA (adenine(2503)-C(2))-methyltransferase RlmN n=1 Tax=Desulforadius tongensis TaxID=1216062 RepID=UPI00195D8EDC|nr:23S rRNA (adenine(2503)-C(2))-methyltransferase RlmN [Desulforadius tongensis]MBM7855743.1 23S rRNA (adenine2503-C2)-methyltransferase [Desulforadius tongensis]